MEWYHDFVEHLSTSLSWSLLKSEFIATFTKFNQSEDAEEQLRKRKWSSNESLDNFFFDVLRLCRLADNKMADQQKLVHLTRGLPNFMKHYVLSRDFVTISEFRKYLHKLNDGNNFIKVQDKTSDSVLPILRSEINAILPNSQKKLFAHHHKPYTRLTTTEKYNLRYKGAVTNTGKPICFNCQHVGHLASTCDNEPFCRYCKKTGHTILVCTTRPF